MHTRSNISEASVPSPSFTVAIAMIGALRGVTILVPLCISAILYIWFWIDDGHAYNMINDGGVEHCSSDGYFKHISILNGLSIVRGKDTFALGAMMNVLGIREIFFLRSLDAFLLFQRR